MKPKNTNAADIQKEAGGTVKRESEFERLFAYQIHQPLPEREQKGEQSAGKHDLP